jgi:hypothetical protein
MKRKGEMDNRREEKAEEEEKTTLIESSPTQHEIRTVITLILIGLTTFSMPHYHIYHLPTTTAIWKQLEEQFT